MTIAKTCASGNSFCISASRDHGIKDMGKPWIDALLAGGGFVALLKFAQWMIEKILSRKKRVSVLEGIESLYHVYSSMEKALGKGQSEFKEKAASCGRVLLLSAHNSGGIPSPAAPFYTSAIHWAITALEHRKAISSYSNVKVDGAYIAILLKLQRDGIYHFKMDENHESMLHDFYKAEGVTDSFLFYIGIINGQFIYMSFASFNGIFDRDQVTGFKLTVNEVKNLIEGGR